MINVTANVRTVALISKDNNGNFGLSTMKDGRKRISFRVAIKTGKTNENENGSKEQETVFTTMTAFGNTAEILAKYATDKKEGGRNGSVQSRFISVSGTLNFYKNQGKQKITDGNIPYELNGQRDVIETGCDSSDELYVMYDQEQWSIVAYNVEFLDSNPEKKATTGNGNSKINNINLKNKFKGKGISIEQETNVKVAQPTENNDLPDFDDDEEAPITADTAVEDNTEDTEIPQVAEDFSGIETPFN